MSYSDFILYNVLVTMTATLLSKYEYMKLNIICKHASPKSKRCLNGQQNALMLPCIFRSENFLVVPLKESIWK